MTRKFVHNRERSRAILMSIIIFDLDSFPSGTAENRQEENSAIGINKTKPDQRSKNLERDVGNDEALKLRMTRQTTTFFPLATARYSYGSFFILFFLFESSCE